jgi:hypothetical protein
MVWKICTPYGNIALEPGTEATADFYAVLDDWRAEGGVHSELVERVEAWAQVHSGAVDAEERPRLVVPVEGEPARGVPEQMC